ncbi:MAG: hypothetical protein Q4A64_07870 [Porphyromonadaceae bacterium]|nr:hypothetical protein [Porphyromonadaceae bacterium]
MLSEEKIDARRVYTPPIALGEVSVSLQNLLITLSVIGEVEEFEGDIEEL